jgi:hypothetical protein
MASFCFPLGHEEGGSMEFNNRNCLQPRIYTILKSIYSECPMGIHIYEYIQRLSQTQRIYDIKDIHLYKIYGLGRGEN